MKAAGGKELRGVSSQIELDDRKILGGQAHRRQYGSRWGSVQLAIAIKNDALCDHLRSGESLSPRTAEGCEELSGSGSMAISIGTDGSEVLV